MGPVKFALLVFYEEFNGLKLRVASCGLRAQLNSLSPGWIPHGWPLCDIQLGKLVFYEELNGLKLRVEGSTLRVAGCELGVAG